MTRSTSNRNSPIWSPSSKRFAAILLLILFALAAYRFRNLVLPLIMAGVLSYLIEPMVKGITRYTPIPRLAAIILMYLILIGMLIAIPISAIPPIVTQVNNLINNTPRYLQQLGELLQEPIFILSFEIPIDQLPLDQFYNGIASNLINIVQTVGGQSLSLFGSVATATISTAGWTMLVVFLSFYLVKDHTLFFNFFLDMVPDAHQEDVYQLGERMSRTWNAFLRGQFVLCVVVGTIIFVLSLVIGLPNALILALIAGLAEFLPSIGPVLAAIPAVLIAFFQHQSSWVGVHMSPFWFAMLVLGIYAFIFQLENYYLVPRIMGHHLKLHPVLVILGALAGASVAGLLGILLAAPVLASIKLVFMYTYHKLTDQPPFSAALPPPKEEGVQGEEPPEKLSPSTGDVTGIS